MTGSWQPTKTFEGDDCPTWDIMLRLAVAESHTNVVTSQSLTSARPKEQMLWIVDSGL